MEIIKQIAESSHFLHTRKRREKGVLEPLVLTLGSSLPSLQFRFLHSTHKYKYFGLFCKSFFNISFCGAS